MTVGSAVACLPTVRSHFVPSRSKATCPHQSRSRSTQLLASAPILHPHGTLRTRLRRPVPHSRFALNNKLGPCSNMYNDLAAPPSFGWMARSHSDTRKKEKTNLAAWLFLEALRRQGITFSPTTRQSLTLEVYSQMHKTYATSLPPVKQRQDKGPLPSSNLYTVNVRRVGRQGKGHVPSSIL